MNKDLIQTLRRLGFSDYEARCYLALFNKDSLAVSEVAKLGNVPRPNAYDALAKLLANGFIYVVPGKSKRYSVSDPAIIKAKSFSPRMAMLQSEIEGLEKKMREKAEAKAALESNIESTMAQLADFYQINRNNKSPLEYIEILKNTDQIHRKHIELQGMAKFEILAFSKPPFSFSNPVLKKEQFLATLKAVKRGVKLRAIHELPENADDRIKMYRDIRDNYDIRYEEARLTEKLPLKMSIQDRRYTVITMVYPTLDTHSLTGLVVDHPAFAEAHIKAFEAYWRDGQDHFIVDNKRFELSRKAPIEKSDKHRK